MNKQPLAQFIGECILRYKTTRFEFQPTKKLKIGAIECTGEAESGRITIATGGDLANWLSVFVHETCHIDQSIERPRWFGSVDALVAKLDEWLGGNDRKKPTWTEICQIIELERDCENRTMGKITQFDLPIPLDEYAQKSNAYLLSYAKTYRERKWDSAPYTKPSRWRKMPKTLLGMDYLEEAQ